MSNILYSIVVPSRGGPHRLRVLIESLARQSIRSDAFEIIIVDDATPDLAGHDVAHFESAFPGLQIDFIRLSTNVGPASARNVGARHARCHTLFFTDDDCEVPALWMEQHIAMLDKHPDVVATVGWYKPLLSEAREQPRELFSYLYYWAIFSPIDLFTFEGKSSRLDSQWDRLFPGVNSANMCVRKAAFEYVGGFNETYFAPGSEDTQLSFDLRQAGFLMYYFPQCVRDGKAPNLLGFMKRAWARGCGQYAFSRLNYRSYYNLGWLDRYTLYAEKLHFLARTNTALKKHIRHLRFLGLIFYFITSAGVMMPLYARAYRKRGRVV